jgi:MFS family permease
MYGSEKDIRHNLKLFFADGVTFMPSMALLSITAVIPYFLEQLGATTFQIALAAAMTMICAFLTQPIFGVIASRSTMMHRTFGIVLLLQRLIFLVFVLLIPLFSDAPAMLVKVFLVFWCIFNIFVGSYSVFHTPLVIKMLPPGRRGALRGVGLAIGSCLGVGMSALIPVILYRIVFPYDYMTIFLLALFFLLVNAAVFFFMRENKNAEPNESMGLVQYIKQMPAVIRGSPSFRAMILTCTFLAAANALLTFYTLYAIRVFSATETHIAILTGLAVLSGAVAFIVFGIVVDRYGPRITALIAACLIIAAGALALTTNSLGLLFVAWVLANLSNNGYNMTVSLLLAEVSPPSKLPLYVGVAITITMAVSAAIVLVKAPILERMGFSLLFATVLACGLISLFVNLFVLKKRLVKR